MTRTPFRIASLVVCVWLAGCSDDPQPSGGDTAFAPPTAEQESGPATAEPMPPPSPVVAVPEPEPAAAPKPEPEPAPAAASTTPTQHVVKGVVTQWAPLVLFVQPGDQIVFRQMTGHDTETIDGMIPEGAEGWKSKLGEEGFAVTVAVPGVYVYKCNPHVSLGMIGAIVVGDEPPANLAAVEAHPDNKGMIGRAVRKLKQALAARTDG